MKNVRHIKRYGHLLYVSKKMKYAVIYVDQAEIQAVENKLMKYPFVSRVERSKKPFLRTDFENKESEKEEEQDYRMGI